MNKDTKDANQPECVCIYTLYSCKYTKEPEVFQMAAGIFFFFSFFSKVLAYVTCYYYGERMRCLILVSLPLFLIMAKFY